jgi:queuine tRNA-ribosyltransferase
MEPPTSFRTLTGQKLQLPLFFPDATRAVIKSLDSQDILNTHTPGVLVNSYHLYINLGQQILKKHQGIRNFMNWPGAIISDSGGFQVMSVAKSGTPRGKVTDQGVTFFPSKKKKVLFTPEKSIQFQMHLNTDLLVVLDDFTPPSTTKKIAKETVDRTILWAKRSKDEFEKICHQQKIPQHKRPYLIAVVQGGEYLDLRKKCAQELAAIGFDGFGYGGWPLTPEGDFNYDVAKIIAKSAPKNYLLYGLGIGKPDEIVNCVNLGYHIFDCVLPTRDARHQRLYVYNVKSVKDIDIHQPDFYSYYTPVKQSHYHDPQPVSTACDCHLCTNYSRSYLAHLFRIGDSSAGRLSSIHNLRFYSILMEKLQQAHLQKS